MQYVHNYYGYKVQKDLTTDTFLLTNGIGGYASFQEENISKFQGVFLNHHFELFKIIENIQFPGKVTKVINHFSFIEKIRGEVSEQYFLPQGKNALVVFSHKPQDMHLVLDCRKMYDFRQWGRKYTITTHGNKILIRYEKRSDKREDTSEGRLQYELYVVIIPNVLHVDLHEQWKQANYSYDKRRKSVATRYVYDACTLKAVTHCVFAYGTTLSEALRTADDLASSLDTVKKKHLEAINLQAKFTFKKEAHVAFLCAQHSLHSLMQRIDAQDGIYAGLYWFHQYWARDELISLKALMHAKKYAFVKKILLRHLHALHDGTLPNRMPETELGCADGVGWLFKRFEDFLTILEKKRIRKQYLSNDELSLMKVTLENACFAAMKRNNHGLITNGPKETWMDTTRKEVDDSRAGARIEMQALHLAMCKFLQTLCDYTKDDAGKKMAKRMEEELKIRVRGNFWNGTFLKDGTSDETIRPNIFLAYYVYPDLLTAKEWITCFNHCLPKLWNGFGVTTIDKENPFFLPEHTGEDDLSYHYGDSWYFINNITAIALTNLSKWRYRKYSTDILNASTQDLLWQGIPGHHSEISSAKKQEAFGCFSQAWSNATFIELCEELL